MVKTQSTFNQLNTHFVANVRWTTCIATIDLIKYVYMVRRPGRWSRIKDGIVNAAINANNIL